jgi:hypothetical protein
MVAHNGVGGVRRAWRRRGRLAERVLCSLLVAGGLALCTSSSALAVATGGITGTVTDSFTNGIKGIEVCAFASNFEELEGFACTETENDGVYTLPGLAPGI